MDERAESRPLGVGMEHAFKVGVTRNKLQLGIFALLALGLSISVGRTSGSQLAGDAGGGCGGEFEEGAFATTERGQSVGGNQVGYASYAARRGLDQSLTVTLRDRSGRQTVFNVPPTPTASLRASLARTYRSRAGRNWCSNDISFSGCPLTGADSQSTCDKVQRKLCKFCSSRDLDQSKCATWAEQRASCQNACTGFAQTLAVASTRQVAACHLTETTLSDGSINITSEENGDRETTWNLPATSDRPFDGEDWCQMNLEYGGCTDPTTCDRVQSKLCSFCSDAATYDQSKCQRWLRKRKDCVDTCEAPLNEVTLADTYSAFESL